MSLLFKRGKGHHKVVVVNRGGYVFSGGNSRIKNDS